MSSRRDILLLVAISLVMTVLVFLFREPVAQAVDWMGSVSTTTEAVFIAIAVFLIGSIFLIPQWALIAAAVAAFGLVEGIGIAWLATMTSTWVHMVVAKTMRQRLKQWIDDARLARLRTLFQQNSVQSGFIVRLVPTGPAIMVNIGAGLFGVSMMGFLIGTAFGIIPKIILTAIVASELISSAQGQQIGLGIVMAGLALIALFALSRRKSAATVPEKE